MSATVETTAPTRPAPIRPKCAPSRTEVLKRANERDALCKLAFREHEAGNEDAAGLLYAVAEGWWDDAIHIADPADHRTSLCGLPYRNLASIDGPRPDSWGGCWSCLGAADRLAAAAPVSTEPAP